MKTPILFLIFNRPDTTQKVFDVIKQIKPKYLFVAADGPRENKSGEKELCEQTKQIVLKNIDWDCEVKTLFREKNLGCGKAVSEAIGWFFESVEKGIILEDDCLPDKSFFSFCEELLEKYRYNEKIFMISGNNFLPNHPNPKESYYFSEIAHIWGWATWKRAWKKYDFFMKNLPIFLKNKEIEKKIKNKEVANYYIDRLNDVYKKRIDTWDYQWLYTIWNFNGLSIVPKHNLISNIGFNKDATHTKNSNSKYSNLKTGNITFPLHHPNKIECNKLFDDYEHNILINKKYIFLKKILKSIGLFEIIRYIYLKIKK